MHLLEAGLAFAVVMIIFSTITTGIAEMIARVLGWRGKFLKHAIHELFDTIVWPRLKHHFADAPQEANRIRDDFVKQLLDNPAGAKSALSRWSKDQQISVLSIVAFAERLGRTEVGQKILAEGHKQIELLVRDFVRSYDRYGRATSEVFRRNTQLVAMFVGILVAIIANVDALRVTSALIEDPKLRRGLIEQVDMRLQENQAARDALKTALSEIGADTTPEQARKDLDQAIEQVEQNRKSIEEIKAIGLPVGAQYFPHCRLFGLYNAFDGCAPDLKTRDLILSGLLWLLMTITAGVLIGLGGPFWFRVFSVLSHLLQTLKSLGVSSSRPEAKPEEITPTSDAAASAKPNDIVEAFKTAAEVHANRTIPSGRVLLGEDGRLIARETS